MKPDNIMNKKNTLLGLAILVLVVLLVKPSASINLGGAPSGLIATVATTSNPTISAAATAMYTAGSYWWQARVAKAGIVKTVDYGTLEIKASLSGVSTPYNGRTHAVIVLEALEAMLENKATLDQQSYAIAGRSISRMSPAEIMEWINVYRSMVLKEKREEGKRRGTTNTSNKVLVRFT